MKVKKRAVRSTLAWIITVAMMASMFVSLPVFADEEKSYDYNNVQSSNVTSNGYWTDVDNYDISWYTGNENSGSYDLTDSADLAGLAYLINNQNVSFGGKTINLTGSTYDMSAHYWVPISACSGAGPHTGGSNCTAWSGTFVIKGSESSTITGLNIIDTVAPASNAANYNYYTGFIGHMNGDVEISNIVFDNCNVEDKGNTVVQDYSSGAAVVIGEARGDSKFNNVIVQNSVISGCTKVAAFLGLKNGSNGGLTFTDCASNNNTFKALYYYNAIVGVTISSTATVVVFDNTSSVNDTFEKFDPNNEAQYFGDGNYITYNGIEYLPLAQTIGGVKYDDALVVGTTKALAAVLGTEAKEIVVNGTTYHVGETAVDNVAKINRNGKDVYYTSLNEALQNAQNGETIVPASENVVITTAVIADLNADITLSGFNFGDGGSLIVKGEHAFNLENCKFEATIPYSAASGVRTPVKLNNHGKTTVKNNTFGTANDGVYYNAVEFDVGSETAKTGITVADGTEISGNSFGKISNNSISIYNVDEGATITIKNNEYKVAANALRLSNGLVDKVNAVFNIENEWYKATGTGDYAGYALFQRSYGGTVQQDMTGYVINFTDLKYGADKTIVTSNDPQQYYVWDGSKIVNDNNVPNVTFNDSTPTQSPEPTAEPVAKINREGKDVYYQSLKAAIEDAKVNETITPASGSVVITTAENAVLANDITVSGFNFGDGGALTVSGNGAFTITDCKFEATAAGVKTPLNLKNYGKTIVKNNTFGTENDGVYYNAVEFDVGSEVNKNGVKVADGTEISGNHFGKITHNGISIYNVEENATITIKDNIYEISASALRLSNGLVDKVNAIFNIENEWYKTTDPTEGWEGYATLQTVYKNGNPEQDVTGYVLNFKNLYYGDESNKKVAEDGDGVQQIVVWNGTDFVTDAEKLPTVSITNDVLPTQSPEATATTEPSATPEATATTEPSATPEATATAKPTSAPVVVPTPYPTATVKPNAPTATPMPEYQVQISASEEISEVLLVNKATGETIALDMEVSEAGEITFVGSAPKGNYEIVAKAVSGKEVDVAQSDNSLKVNDDKTEAVVVATEESSIDYIEIKNAPDTVSYTEGSTFKPAGLVITVHYKDGTSQDVAYDESTKSGFTFKPGLDVSLPSADAYVGDTYVRVIYGNKYADQNVTFVMNSAEIEITAPKSNAAATFAAAVEEGSYYYSGIITWSPNVEQGGKFDYGTVYTATVTLAAKDGYSFADNAKALVNGNEAEVNEISPDGKTMTVSYTFDKTGYKNSGNSGNSGHSTGGTSTPKPAETANPNVSASPEPTKNPSSWTNPFNDVNTSDWFYDGVKYVNENGLMNGIETDTFGPYENITRGMFVTVLHRMENQPKTDMTNFGFTDVPEGFYYREAIGWASANGVVNGYTDTEFAPDQIITREQMAAMIYRYVVSKGMGPVGSWMINLDYNDVSSISDYAFEAVTYNKIIGIMSGDDNNNFNPQTAANRAEASLVFQRLANFIGQQKAE
ncbi:S-layer homology domain-containing protein [Monoglobus pectinilyticus]|uniref:S-layer homology domain-containing protein n=1 Tax=Monoglobus pectinilyticus TaxID=1981510 RepID=UPI003AB64B53